MSVVVGVAPDESGSAALALGALWARSLGTDVVVTSVVALPWPPRPEALDADYRQRLEQVGQQALARAAAELDGQVPARFELRHARSVPAGLAEAVADQEGTVLVLGSSSGGAFGRISFGSVIERLLHGAAVPVAIAPRGFRCAAGSSVRRVTVAFGGATTDVRDLLLATSTVTDRIEASLRVASFFIRPAGALAGTIDASAEDLVSAEWAAYAREAVRGATPEMVTGTPRQVETVVGDGYTLAGAIEDVAWSEGDVLVIGSSGGGPLSQVFLGSRASKIVRHSPVPVVVVPRTVGVSSTTQPSTSSS